MLIVVLVVLCVASLAAAELQTMRLRTLQQKMDALRQNVEHEVRKQEALWHDMVHDLRNPAACMYSLAQLIQENRNGDPEQLNHWTRCTNRPRKYCRSWPTRYRHRRI